MSEPLFAALAHTPAVQALRQRVEKGGVLSFADINTGAHAFLGVLLRHLFPGRPIIIVAAGVKAQESMQQDTETWLQVAGCKLQADSVRTQPSSCKSLYYPAWEVLPQDEKLPHVDVVSERLETLIALAASSSGSRLSAAPIIVTNVVALLQRTFQPETIRTRTRRLARGERISPTELVEWLESQGYEPEAEVSLKGNLAMRGGIVDVFPPSSPWPVRLEFFGDELESLRHFDPTTQISTQTIDTVTLPPAGELGILKRGLPKATEGEAGKKEGRGEKSGLATLVDYLPTESIFLFCDPQELITLAKYHTEQTLPHDPFYVDWQDLRTQIGERGMTIVELEEALETQGERSDEKEEAHELPIANQALELAFNSLESFRPISTHVPDPQVAEAQRREFFNQLHRWSRQGYSVHVFCNNEGERQRFVEIWQEYGIGPPLPAMHLGALTRGFICEPGKLVVVTDAEVFGRYKVQRPRRLKSPHAPTSRSLLDIDFTDLEEGDYVVHLEHGIGRYLGLTNMPATAGEKPLEKATAASENMQECLAIEYASPSPDQPPPKLYVPVSEAHLVSKYVGAGKARPSLNTLGGGRWAKTKAQAEQAVRDVASELLAIQAARASQPGHAFPEDAPWQREFESAFLFEETPDQMKAILATKADMEKPKPMDRLICGDVGYGKTEVAIRAAFKAVLGGKQVAILVPTTILAQQHFNTFGERMADYPVRLELLSRFRTASQQRAALQGLKNGTVDIVIGTHRLLQNDIAFKDLGLVVIDEEQRFGVLHKEKFKRLRRLVDVLTLSATPIPRTLYLALTGARDMSTIETPPQDRLPVETIVAQYDERLIRDAIQREVNRGGQVFYLHNRVLDIEEVARRLRDLLPKARIVVGHGQMEDDDLEEVMTRFVSGEADVLLSTTIIESGLDIPNANTIIIDRADRFGLSDLYQLRGRVGRYKHQAYAYLLLPRHAGLLTDARKRINAIKQYSTLGSGFKIAMRDLEIRGAGNMLGPQQSGHITAVGFDLYCQLLQQSVGELMGEKPKVLIDVPVRLDFLLRAPKDRPKGPRFPSVPEEQSVKAKTSSHPLESAAIPVGYISESAQRVEIYRKLAQITELSAAKALRKELRDRFGPVPSSVELLLDIALLKVTASERGITSIETREDKLLLTRNDDYVMLKGKFPRLTKGTAKERIEEINKWVRSL